MSPLHGLLTKLGLYLLSRSMKQDLEFAWAWHCNIAMAAQDAGAPRKEANIRSRDFMKTAFGVDVSTLPQYKYIINEEWKKNVGTMGQK